jgi:hypothetical protein
VWISSHQEQVSLFMGIPVKGDAVPSYLARLAR